jgi:hypothetical protein
MSGANEVDGKKCFENNVDEPIRIDKETWPLF